MLCGTSQDLDKDGVEGNARRSAHGLRVKGASLSVSGSVVHISDRTVTKAPLRRHTLFASTSCIKRLVVSAVEIEIEMVGSFYPVFLRLLCARRVLNIEARVAKYHFRCSLVRWQMNGSMSGPSGCLIQPVPERPETRTQTSNFL